MLDKTTRKCIRSVILLGMNIIMKSEESCPRGRDMGIPFTLVFTHESIRHFKIHLSVNLRKIFVFTQSSTHGGTFHVLSMNKKFLNGAI